MSDMAYVRKQVKEFLNDPSMQRIEIKVPRSFRPWKIVNQPALVYRKIVLFAQRWIIPSKFKNALLRTTGLRIGREVCIPNYITFDAHFPQLITIDDESLIGGLCTLTTHKLRGDTLILGRVHVKSRVLIAGLTMLDPGVTVHEECITGMRSHITKDVPKGSFAVGNDRIVKQWSKEELERHFGVSSKDPNYHRSFHEKVRAFQRDPSQMRLTVRYEGLRGNPGNEWYRARALPRIYYNALFVELARLAPGSWLRKLLLRCMGAKIGRGVYIGRNVVFDHIYGDLAVVEHHAYIGDNCYIDGHSYTITETDFGRVHIKAHAKLDRDVHVFCGVTIGEHALVHGPSSVMKDVPDGEVWAGIPAKKVENI